MSFGVDEAPGMGTASDSNAPPPHMTMTTNILGAWVCVKCVAAGEQRAVENITRIVGGAVPGVSRVLV